MSSKKFLDIIIKLVSKELTKAGRVNLAFGGLLIFLDIILSINIEIPNYFFYGTRDFPTLAVTIFILVYVASCIGYLFFRDYKKND